MLLLCQRRQMAHEITFPRRLPSDCGCLRGGEWGVPTVSALAAVGKEFVFNIHRMSDLFSELVFNFSPTRVFSFVGMAC